jgi:putative glutathione S-transferase
MQYITTRITADGADGYRTEPGRPRLIVARACHRALAAAA